MRATPFINTLNYQFARKGKNKLQKELKNPDFFSKRRHSGLLGDRMNNEKLFNSSYGNLSVIRLGSLRSLGYEVIILLRDSVIRLWGYKVMNLLL